MKKSFSLGIAMLVVLTNGGGLLGAPLTNRRGDVTQDHPINEDHPTNENHPTEDQPRIDRDKLHELLKMYGYMTQGTTKNSAGYVDKEKEALMRVQKFFKLNITGELDNQTIEIFVAPRCSMPDIEIDQSGRQKRYDAKYRWPLKSLTYWVQNLPSTYTGFVDYNDIYSKIDEAFQMWTENSGLTITKSPNSFANINLAFYKNDHGCDSPFDGPGKEVGHAYYPPSGIIHFDDSERWSKTNNYINLKQVAAHEIGHALGLRHTNDINALMYPKYLGYQSNFKLGSDDIAGIQSLYGPNLKPRVPTTTTTLSPWASGWKFNWFFGWQ